MTAPAKKAEGAKPSSTIVEAKVPGDVPQVADALRWPQASGLKVGFDEFTGRVMLTSGDAPSPVLRPLVDEDYTRMREHLQRRCGFKSIKKETMRDVVHMVAHEFAFDSAKQWLRTQKWDGVPRVDSLLVRYFGAADTPYTRAVSRYLMTALAGRVMVPGIKADMVPVAVGRQGTRKSSTIAAMAPSPDFFGEMDLSERDDNTARMLQGKLLVELPELKGLRARDNDSTKKFISATFDEWVQKYQENARQRPRRCVLFGSTNEPDFLIDASGARRWLPFEAGPCDPDAMARDREQLWAEGASMFIDRGAEIDFEAAERLASEQHVKFEAADPWQTKIEAYTTNPQKFGFDDEGAGPQRPLGASAGGSAGPLTWVTANELMTNCLCLRPNQMSRATEQRIGPILRKLGWERDQKKIAGKTTSGWTREL